MIVSYSAFKEPILFRQGELWAFCQTGRIFRVPRPSRCRARGKHAYHDIMHSMNIMKEWGKNVNILVTGGAGFIGSHLLEQLNSDPSIHVVVYDNLSSGKREHVPGGMELVEGDICDRDSLERVFAAHRFDVVVHLAAQTLVPYSVAHPAEDCRINLEGLLHVLECCRKYGTGKVIFSSSAAVYGNSTRLPLDEGEPLSPMSPYGISKMASEHYLRLYAALYGIRAHILRFANVYGERQGAGGEGGVVSIYCRQISRDLPVTVYGSGEQTRDFVYAGDVARTIRACLTLEGSHVFNVSTDRETTLNELIDVFGQAAGAAPDVIREAPRKGDILHSVLDNTRLRVKLGYAPATTLAEGVARTYRWYKENLDE